MKKILLVMMSVVMMFGLTACGGEDEVVLNLDVNAVWDEIAADNPEMAASVGDLEIDLLEQFYGITADQVETFVAKAAFISVTAEEYFIAKATEGNIEALQAAVEKRIVDLEAQWSMYLPAQYEKVQNNRVVVNGDYILFVVADDPQVAVDAFNNGFTAE